MSCDFLTPWGFPGKATLIRSKRMGWAAAERGLPEATWSTAALPSGQGGALRASPCAQRSAVPGKHSFVPPPIHSQIFLECSLWAQAKFSAQRVLETTKFIKINPLFQAAQCRRQVSGERESLPQGGSEDHDWKRKLPPTEATALCREPWACRGHPRTANPTSWLTLHLSAAHTHQL